MDIKTIPEQPVIFFSTKTNLIELPKLVGNVALSLYKEAAAQDLLPTGPIAWIYYGADGNPTTEFLLEIALPVNAAPKEESVSKYKTLPKFHCAASLHYGGWDKLGVTYQQMAADLQQNGKNFSGIAREQYIYMDFNDPSNHLTEVQLGL